MTRALGRSVPEPFRFRTLAVVAVCSILAVGCGSGLPLSKIADAAHGNSANGNSGPDVGTSGNASSGPASVSPVSTAGTPGTAVGSGPASAVISSGTGSSASAAGPHSTSSAGASATSNNAATSSGAGSGSGDHSPILIGSVGDYSGAPGAVLAAEGQTVQVWAKWENAHGGVDGHPINVIVEDDQGNPSTYQSEIEDLVNNKHVLAFVDNGANLTAQAGESFLDSKQIPVIGAGDGNTAWTSNEMYFNLQGQIDAAIGGELLEANRQLHAVKVAEMACVESQACASYYNDGPRLAAALGMKVVYSARVSITQPDFTAECLQAQSNGAQVVQVSADENTFHRIVQSCNQQGYHPDWTAPSPSDGDSQQSGLSNTVSGNGAFPFDGDSQTPAVQEYVQAFHTYAGGALLSQYTALSWAAAKLFQHVIDTSIGSGIPTTAKILTGLWSVNNYNVDGLALPLTYKAHSANLGTPTDCWFPLLFSSGHWTGPATPECDPRV